MRAGCAGFVHILALFRQQQIKCRGAPGFRAGEGEERIFARVEEDAAFDGRCAEPGNEIIAAFRCPHHGDDPELPEPEFPFAADRTAVGVIRLELPHDLGFPVLIAPEC